MQTLKRKKNKTCLDKESAMACCHFSKWPLFTTYPNKRQHKVLLWTTQEPRCHKALYNDLNTAAQPLQKASRAAWAEARGLETMPQFVGRQQAPLWAPLEEAAPHEHTPSTAGRHGTALAPEPASARGRFAHKQLWVLELGAEEP